MRLVTCLFAAATLLHSGTAVALDVEKCAFIHHAASVANVSAIFTDMHGETTRLDGSGFIVTGDGYLLTDAHVVRPPTTPMNVVKVEIVVTFGDTSAVQYMGMLIKKDDDLDVALIKIPQTGAPWPTTPLGKSKDVEVGDSLFGMGYSGGNLALTQPGLRSARNGAIGGIPAKWWQTTLNLNPGYSGGPIFDATGRVVGLAEGYNDAAQGVGYVIPLQFAKDLLDNAGASTKGQSICGPQIEAPLTQTQVTSAGSQGPSGPGVSGYVYYEEKNGSLTQDGVFGPPDGSPARKYADIHPGVVLRSVSTARLRQGPTGLSMIVELVPAGTCVKVASNPTFPVVVNSATSGGHLMVTTRPTCEP